MDSVFKCSEFEPPSTQHLVFMKLTPDKTPSLNKALVKILMWTGSKLQTSVKKAFYHNLNAQYLSLSSLFKCSP